MGKMANAEKTKREKARRLRYRKPIVKDLNLATIIDELWEIQSACEDIQWYCDTDDDSLINALAGDEDEAYEFRMMFSDLCAECERMQNDLNEVWVPDCFDRFFVAIGAGKGMRATDSLYCYYLNCYYLYCYYLRLHFRPLEFRPLHFR